MDVIYGLIIAILVSLLLIYYNKYYRITHDTHKYVFLIDFDKHLKNIGQFVSFGSNPTSKTFLINVLGEQNVIEEWTILLETKYNFANISCEYTDYLFIWCNFIKSNFENRVIQPLFDMSIVKIGLQSGLEGINDKTCPLYEQIEYFKNASKSRDNRIREMQRKFDEDHLLFLKEECLAIKRFMDTVQQDVVIGPIWGAGKRLVKREEALKGMQRFVDKELSRIEDEAAPVATPSHSTPPPADDPAGAQEIKLPPRKPSIEPTEA